MNDFQGSGETKAVAALVRGADERRRVQATFLAGGGDMGALMRSLDWAQTPLGPPETWPQSLRTSVSTCLNCAFPILIWWGPDLVMLYNDDYRPILGDKHPRSMGQKGRECWPEIWDVIGPMLNGVIEAGEAARAEDLLLLLERSGYPEECYFSFSYSPIRDESGGVAGVFTPVKETTEKVIGERRLRTLRDLAARGTQAADADAACAAAARTLAGNPHDLPFALLYRMEPGGARARLVGAAGMAFGTAASPRLVELEGPDDAGRWPLAEVARGGRAAVVDDLARRFGPLPSGAWPDPPHAAVVLPVVLPGQEHPAALLVTAVSPRKRLDEAYRSFLDLVAGQIAAVLADALAYEAERERAEALAEIDRAKTLFFSNVSHEFRTPLTLMLGPIEETLRRPSVAGRDREDLTVAHRNGLRLLKLVNSLLDFSRVEAGRAQAVYQPVDLATFTADLASSFRSACERAGLRLAIDCPNLPEPVHVDRDMWEKIVLNLLSNAFKFTFEGEIAVMLRAGDGNAELTVRDTGTGIPEAELPRIFDRFHRVEGAGGRTHEGTGIGLALVQELVKLHGGTVRAASTVGEGTSFTIRVPFGTAHLPADRIGGTRTQASTATRAAAYVEEALRWLPDGDHAVSSEPSSAGDLPAVVAGSDRPRVLLADDNADMRDYVRRLLSAHYEVEAAADGQAALAAARARRPDLVLADVMMPRLDGFGLLEALRADPALSGMPVVLLSARAGEEARVEGLKAGADDYLVKPFGARELLARIESNLKLARVRQEATTALRESEARFRTLVGSSPLPILAIDRNAAVRLWNAAAEELFGWTAAEVIGRIVPFVPADKLDEDAACHAAVLRGDICSIETRRLRRDGSLVEVSLSAAPLRDARGEIAEILVLLNDITERKRAEAALERVTAESERQKRLYETIISSTPDLVYVFDLDYRFTFANRALLQMWGRTIEESVGKSLLEIGYEPWHAEMHEREIDEVVATKRPIRGEVAFPHATLGRRIYDYIFVPVLNVAGEVERIAGTTRDITEHKRAEEALRRRTAQFETLLNEAPLGVYLVDADFRLREVNPTARPVFGDIPDLIGRDFDEVIHVLWPKAYADDIVARFRRTLETGEPYVVHERAEERRDRGVTEYYEWRINRIPLPDGGYGVVCYFQDISPQVQARLAIAASEARFRAYVTASSDVVYRMSPDWSEMRHLRGRDFIADTLEPSYGWLDKYIHPDDQREVMEAIDQAVRTRSTFELEHRVRRLDGTLGWTLSRAVPLLDETGEVTEWFGAASDVTARKQAEQHLRLLIDELNHRVKNTLATVQSIVAQALRRAPLADDLRDAIEARLMALSRSHDLLTRESWETASLREVVHQAVEPFSARGQKADRIVLDGDEVRLRPKLALALGMAFHELATNAAKYGALSGETGGVRIGWAVEGARLRLRWKEFDGPAVMPPSRKGFGSRLIERGLAHDLDGVVRLDYAPDGVVCDIDMPAPAAARGA